MRYMGKKKKSFTFAMGIVNQFPTSTLVFNQNSKHHYSFSIYIQSTIRTLNRLHNFVENNHLFLSVCNCYPDFFSYPITLYKNNATNLLTSIAKVASDFSKF